MPPPRPSSGSQYFEDPNRELADHGARITVLENSNEARIEDIARINGRLDKFYNIMLGTLVSAMATLVAVIITAVLRK